LLHDDVFEVSITPDTLSTYEQCIFNKYEGQLDTGKLYNALLKEAKIHGVEIIKGLEVLRIDSSNGKILCALDDITISMSADHIIVATNSLTTRLMPQLDVIPVRNQVIVTNPIPGHGLKGCFHQDQGYIYFRDIGDRILIGGARHLFDQEETSEFGDNPDNKMYLLHHIQKYVAPHKHDIKMEYDWSGILSGGGDRLPIIERVSDKVTVAARLSGMGVAIGIDVGIDAATLSLQ